MNKPKLMPRAPCIAYEEPDTDEDVTLDDLRAISKRHAVTEESADPLPGWPEGWVTTNEQSEG